MEEYEELAARLKAEYNRMLERWESGQLYYHFKAFIRKYARTGWVRYELVKKPVCAVLATSRLGLPITTPTMAFLLAEGKNMYRAEAEAYQKLTYLASYGVLEPVETLRSQKGLSVRSFKLTSMFIETVYKSLSETLSTRKEETVSHGMDS